MDKSNTSSLRMPAAAMLAGVCIVFLLSGCPSKPKPWHNINTDSLLTADKPMMDSMKAIPPLTPTAITVDSLRKMLGVTSAVPDTTLLRWLRYSTKITKTVSYSPLLSDPSNLKPTVSSFGGEKLPIFFIHDRAPAETYSVTPEFSDHEVSNSFNCVRTTNPSRLDMLAGQMGTTIYSWSSSTTTGRTYWFAPNAISGCNPEAPSSYVPYTGSENQGQKWKATSDDVKSDFIGALNAYAFAAASSTTVSYTFRLENLSHGNFNILAYGSVSFFVVPFSPTEVVYYIRLNNAE